MELKDRIAMAKTIARTEYNKGFKEPEQHRREWIKQTLDNGTILYCLDGSPDKAYVRVNEDGSVSAMRQDLSVIQILKD